MQGPLILWKSLKFKPRFFLACVGFPQISQTWSHGERKLIRVNDIPLSGCTDHADHTTKSATDTRHPRDPYTLRSQDSVRSINGDGLRLRCLRTEVTKRTTFQI